MGRGGLGLVVERFLGVFSLQGMFFRAQGLESFGA